MCDSGISCITRYSYCCDVGSCRTSAVHRARPAGTTAAYRFRLQSATRTLPLYISWKPAGPVRYCCCSTESSNWAPELAADLKDVEPILLAHIKLLFHKCLPSQAGMAELADAADSKSAGTWYLGGSTPPPGTSILQSGVRCRACRIESGRQLITGFRRNSRFRFPLPVGKVLAQFRLQQLSRRCMWELLREHKRVRDLPAGKALLQEST